MKKINLRSKKWGIISLVMVLVIGIVAGTLAYFYTNFDVTNTFTTGKADAKFVENFEAPGPDELIYGNTYKKEGTVVNSGEYDVIARAKVLVKWDSDQENLLVDTTYGATLNFSNSVDSDTNAYATYWPASVFSGTKDTVNGYWQYEDDGYFYFKRAASGTHLANSIYAGETSVKLLGSVTFASELGNTTTTTNWYVKSAYDANPTTAQAYSTQAAASAAAALLSEKEICFVSESSLIYDRFKDSQFLVQIVGDIQQADAPWS